jgi:hypothetical protein
MDRESSDWRRFIGMSKRFRYAEELISTINLRTGEMDVFPETPEQRSAGLRKGSNARRAAAFANKDALEATRKEAIAEAWRLYYAGTPMPIHFDIIHRRGKYTKTERCTLRDTGFHRHVFKETEIVGSFGAIMFQTNRSKNITAQFVWQSV